MQAIQSTERHSDPMEHRWGQRVTLEVPVRLLLAGRVLGRGIVRNASISGALIETPLELPLFTNLVVALPTTSEVANTSQELAACVVRRAPGGIAVEWRDMACPAIVTLLERVTGRQAARLLVDEAFARGSGTGSPVHT
jgi:hypothetical protein